MTAAVAGALLLVSALIQVTALPAIAIAGAEPNLILLLVATWTWRRGARAGLAWALAGGLILDLAAPGPLGIHAIATLAGAYAVGLIAARVGDGNWALPAAAAAAATLVYGLIVIGAGQILGQPVPAPAVARGLLGASALYNAVLMPAVLQVVARLDVRLPRQPERW